MTLNKTLIALAMGLALAAVTRKEEPKAEAPVKPTDSDCEPSEQSNEETQHVE